MAKTPTPIRSPGPTISAVDPWAPSAGHIRQLLTDDGRARLTVMSSIVRFKKREVIYLEGDAAEAVFDINTGVVAAYKVAPDGFTFMRTIALPKGRPHIRYDDRTLPIGFRVNRQFDYPV